MSEAKSPFTNSRRLFLRNVGVGTSALGVLGPGALLIPSVSLAVCEPPGVPGSPRPWRADCRPIRPRRPASTLSDAEVQKLKVAYQGDARSGRERPQRSARLHPPGEHPLLVLQREPHAGPRKLAILRVASRLSIFSRADSRQAHQRQRVPAAVLGLGDLHASQDPRGVHLAEQQHQPAVEWHARHVTVGRVARRRRERGRDGTRVQRRELQRVRRQRGLPPEFPKARRTGPCMWTWAECPALETWAHSIPPVAIRSSMPTTRTSTRYGPTGTRVRRATRTPPTPRS